jgi:hypothetical protein
MRTAKNIVVQFLYKVPGRTDFSIYEDMLAVSGDSFRKNMQRLDEVVVLRGKVQSLNEVFRKVFYETLSIHKSGNVNVLVAAPDILCRKPATVFGRFEEMRLFMRTDAPTPEDLRMYFNDGPRYFPATMDPALWDLGVSLWEHMADDKGARAMGNVWGYGQYIHNRMFFAQPEIERQSVQDLKCPELGYQFSNGEADNGIPIADACIIHFHGTRGQRAALTNMRNYMGGR